MRLLFGGLLLVGIAMGVVLFFSKKKHNPFIDGSPYNRTTGGHGRKKILIFSSKGGGGHISVANALQEYFGNDYTIGTTYIFSDVLGRFDPIMQLTRGASSGEDLYNYFIKHKWNTPLSMSYSIGSTFYNLNRKKIEATLKHYLLKHKPDLIVSVIPIINNMIYNVAKDLHIPFLLIPTDLDPEIALTNISKPDYKKFHLALSYNDPLITKRVAQAGIEDKHISFTGFPVKKAFLGTYPERKTKRDFEIPAEKPVVLLLMGAQGSRELYSYARKLAKLKTPAHLLIAIGKSEHMRPLLKKITFPDHITYDIIGFTDRIPDLMSVADLIISKSGSVSVNEAIYSNLPLLLDGTSTPLRWERLNHTLIKSHGFGDVITRYSAVPHTVDQLLNSPEQLEGYKHNLEEYDKHNAKEELTKLIRALLKNSSH